MPDRSAGVRPRPCSRAAVSRSPKPQSSIRQFAPDSTSSALPALPLPSQRSGSPQLLIEQRENFLGGSERSVPPSLVSTCTTENWSRHHSDVSTILHLAGSCCVLALPESQFREETVILLGVVGIRVDIAHQYRPRERSLSSTVNPTRSRARPTRRQARSKRSSTSSVPEPSSARPVWQCGPAFGGGNRNPPPAFPRNPDVPSGGGVFLLPVPDRAGGAVASGFHPWQKRV